MPSFSCTVNEDIVADLRLDRYISEHLKILSRSQIKARNLEARLNGKPVKISRILKGGECLELSWKESEAAFLIPEDLPLNVVYEDNRVIVLNKAQGMVVHPGAGNRQGTLANALLYRRINNPAHNKSIPERVNALPAGSAKNNSLRPGIVHRLDKDTSGLIIAAWDEEAHAFLASQFKERKVIKSYAALVRGRPVENTGCIDKQIIRSKRDRKTFTVTGSGGRRSITRYRVVNSYGKYSLLLLRPKTGRTHQIRVHLKYLGTPILGDPIYGSPDPMYKNAPLMLHAKRLSIILPGNSGLSFGSVTFRTALPERFNEILRAERNRSRK